MNIDIFKQFKDSAKELKKLTLQQENPEKFLREIYFNKVSNDLNDASLLGYNTVFPSEEQLELDYQVFKSVILGEHLITKADNDKINILNKEDIASCNNLKI